MIGQHEMRLGPVGVVVGGRGTVRECSFVLEPGQTVCPVCGWARDFHAGEKYPAGKIQRFDWALAQTIKNLTGDPPYRNDPTAKLVLLALVAHDKPNGSGVFPSHERLVEMTGLSPRAIVNALTRLQAAGWITRVKFRRGGRQTVNRYRIHQAELLSARGALGQSARGAH